MLIEIIVGFYDQYSPVNAWCFLSHGKALIINKTIQGITLKRKLQEMSLKFAVNYVLCMEIAEYIPRKLLHVCTSKERLIQYNCRSKVR